MGSFFGQPDPDPASLPASCEGQVTSVTPTASFTFSSPYTFYMAINSSFIFPVSPLSSDVSNLIMSKMELLILLPEFGTVPAFYTGQLGASIYTILCTRNLESPLTFHLPLSFNFIHYQVISFSPPKSTLKLPLLRPLQVLSQPKPLLSSLT